MTTRYDIHCHLFNDVAFKLRVRIVAEIVEQLLKSPFISNARLRNIAEFLNILDARDSTTIYEDFLSKQYLFDQPKSYTSRCVLVPLTLDLMFFDTGADFAAQLVDAIRKLDDIAKKPGADVTTVRLLQDRLSALREGLTPRALVTQDGFEKQLQQIEALASSYNQRIMPFVCIDPRHGKDAVMARMQRCFPNGTRKIYHGVKLYAPLGFSPLDPVLLEVYDFCSRHSIPVTAHCSYGGFSTFVSQLEVTGIIRRRTPEGNWTLCTVDKETISFTEPLFYPRIKELAQTLNHPDIWACVLHRFPKLRLNLAHFGGDSDCWRERIWQLMATYDNLYSDLSCICDPHQLCHIARTYFSDQHDQRCQRVMYGSDWHVLTFFQPDLGQYYHNFERVSGAYFDKLTIENPERFLG